MSDKLGNPSPMPVVDREDIVAMARAAEKDERLSDGALYGKLADEIEHQRELVEAISSTAAELRRKLFKIAEHPDTPELIKQYAAGRLG